MAARRGGGTAKKRTTQPRPAQPRSVVQEVPPTPPPPAPPPVYDDLGPAGPEQTASYRPMAPADGIVQEIGGAEEVEEFVPFDDDDVHAFVPYNGADVGDVDASELAEIEAEMSTTGNFMGGTPTATALRPRQVTDAGPTIVQQLPDVEEVDTGYRIVRVNQDIGPVYYGSDTVIQFEKNKRYRVPTYIYDWLAVRDLIWG